MSEPFIGEIRMFGFNFAPRGWALCNGQQLAIQQNAALFSLLGTTYGGNGVSTFQLPNLQGRVPIHMGTGAGLSTQVPGEMSGSENTTLLVSNLPSHNHTLAVNSGAGTQASPSGTYLAESDRRDFQFASSSNATMAASAISSIGSNIPISIMQPYLVVNFCIALVGIFPSRN